MLSSHQTAAAGNGFSIAITEGNKLVCWGKVIAKKANKTEITEFVVETARKLGIKLVRDGISVEPLLSAEPVHLFDLDKLNDGK